MLYKNCIQLPSGTLMPCVGLGTWQATNEKEVESAVNTALEAGYRHIDTAYIYNNEPTIGRVLRSWISKGQLRREDLFITSKLPALAMHPDKVEQFLEKSLRDLGLGYVDLYLVHFPIGFRTGGDPPELLYRDNGDLDTDPASDHCAIWKKMEEQVRAGRAKNIGLSNYNISQIQEILKCANIKPANLQVELHVFLQQQALVDFCHGNNISVVAFSPLGNPSYNNFAHDCGAEARELPNILGNPVINKIANKHGKTSAQIALRFLLERNIGVIPKSITPGRIRENFNILDFNLDASDMKELLALDVGEDARVFDCAVFKGLSSHPDFPFKR